MLCDFWGGNWYLIRIFICKFIITFFVFEIWLKCNAQSVCFDMLVNTSNLVCASLKHLFWHLLQRAIFYNVHKCIKKLT